MFVVRPLFLFSPPRLPSLGDERLSTVVNADNIAVLDKGRCIEQGTHDKLIAMGGVYSSLVARQVRLWKQHVWLF